MLKCSRVLNLLPAHCPGGVLASCHLHTRASCYTPAGPVVDQYEEDYATLGVTATVDAAGARDAFLSLAKRYHPDSGHPAASEARFKAVEKSYRRLLHKFSDERRRQHEAEGEYGLYYEQKKKHQDQPAEDSTQEKGFYNIKTSAPQHRQYLSYEGIGLGTPSQREKQFAKFKAMRATENIIDYKVQQLQQDYPETALVAKDKAAARNIKTRYGMERVVEDLIQESMARGDFDNLPCAGKPLQHDNYNPYLDIATHKLNQVLIDNGYAPEWVQLEREIRDDKDWIKNSLRKVRAKLGSLPLAPHEQKHWNDAIALLDIHLVDLNKKIDKYNLLVPVLNKQMVHYPIERIAAKILAESFSKDHPDVGKFLFSLSKVPHRSTILDETVNVSKTISDAARNRPKRIEHVPVDNLLQEFWNAFKRDKNG